MSAATEKFVWAMQKVIAMGATEEQFADLYLWQDRGACQRCGRPIAYDKLRDRLCHALKVSGFAYPVPVSVGCRSASRDFLGDWDDSLPRHWTAL